MSSIARKDKEKLTAAYLRTDKGGTVYYVDGNSGSDTNPGNSWALPYKTLAVAFAASHADIARGSDRWARRNTIYIAGDSFTEDLIIFPQKTDVIGVGSYNGHYGPNILGNHAPVNAGFGCRFFDVNFEPVAVAAIMTLTGVCWGAEFHNCTFRADGTLIAAVAIDMTACPHVRIINCRFVGGFTGDVIDIGAGAIDDMMIKGNTIIGGANDGIVETGTATMTGTRRGLIADNYISVAARTIVTNATSVFDVINNRLITAAAITTPADCYVIDLSFACGNLLTAADAGKMLPRWTVVAT